MDRNHRKKHQCLTLAVSTALAALLSSNIALAQQDEEDINQADETTSEESADLGAVTVTGSHLELSPDELSRQVLVYTAEDLTNMGEVNLERALQRLPQNFSALSAASVGQELGSGELTGGFIRPGNDPDFAGAATVNLRGVGIRGDSSGTLILVNGKRLARSGAQGNIQDISTIPLSFVERVEVILDGASAIYGADAIGGVVNIILKEDLNGVEASLSYLDSVDEFGSQEVNFELAGGKSWAGGNFTYGFAYKSQPEVSAIDLNLESYFDGPRFNIITGELVDPSTNVATSPPNFRNASGIGHAPAGTGINPTIDDLVLGQQVKQDILNGERSILPEVKEFNFHVGLNQELSDNLELQARAYYVDRETYNNRGWIGAGVTLDADDPRNPFDERTTIYADYSGMPTQQTDATKDSYGLSLGLDWQVNDRWSIAFAAQQDYNDQSDVNMGSLDAGFFPDITNFNPWGDGSDALTTPYIDDLQGAGPGVIVDQQGNEFTGTIYDFLASTGVAMNDTEGEETTVSVIARGELFDLPGGSIAVSVGGEYRDLGLLKDGQRPNVSSGVRLGSGFNVIDTFEKHKSLFAEVNIPIVGPQQGIPLVQQLNLTYAVREENVEIGGRTVTAPPTLLETIIENQDWDASTYSLGLSWAPTDIVRVKASYDTAFKIQPIQSLYAFERELDFAPLCDRFATIYRARYNHDIPDGWCNGPFLTPTNPDWQPLPFTRVTGGNPELRPERSETIAASVEIYPISDLRLSIGWNEKDYKDKAISVFTLGRNLGPAIIDLLPQAFEFYSDGTVKTYFANLINLQSAKQANLDFNVDYTWRSNWGDFNVRYNLTHELENNELLGIGDVPEVDLLRIRNPRNSSQTNLTWNRGNWFLGADTIYRGKTLPQDFNIDNLSGIITDSYYVTNLRGAYTFDSSDGWTSGMRVSLTINNVFESDPDTFFYWRGENIAQVQTSSRAQINPRLRFFTLALTKTF